MKLATILVAAVALASCGRLPFSGASGPFSGLGGGGLRGESVEVGGLRFRSRIVATTADQRGFVVTTRGAGRDVPSALEAGRLRAVRHCLTRFGESDIVWTLSPDRPLAEVALNDDGSLAIAGVCVAR